MSEAKEKAESPRLGGAESDGSSKELARLAKRYWRLWRRNWRPPFTHEDAPRPLSGERGR